MARRAVRRPRMQRRPRRVRRRNGLQRPEVPLTSAMSWYPFKGTTYVDSPSTLTGDFVFTVSMNEIATAVCEEMIGEYSSNTAMQNFFCYIHALRVTVQSTKVPLNVKFLVPRFYTETPSFLQGVTEWSPYTEKECYPTPVRYPSVSYVYPRQQSRIYTGGAGSHWFKVGMTDAVVASVRVQKPTDPIRVLLTYDVRYRWSEQPFHASEQPAPTSTSFAKLRGWDSKLKKLNDQAERAHKQDASKKAEQFKPPYRIPRSVPSTAAAEALGSMMDLQIGSQT